MIESKLEYIIKRKNNPLFLVEENARRKIIIDKIKKLTFPLAFFSFKHFQTNFLIKNNIFKQEVFKDLWKEKLTGTDKDSVEEIIKSLEENKKYYDAFCNYNKFETFLYLVDEITKDFSYEDCLKKINKKNIILHLEFCTNQRDIICLDIKDSLVATSSDDGSIKIFNLNELKMKYDVKRHLAGVWCLKFVSHYLISGSIDKNIGIFNLNNRELLSRRDHRSTVRSLATNDKFFFSGGRDNLICVYDYNGNLVKHLRKHSGSVRCLDCNSSFLVSGSYDKTFILWDLKTMSCVWRNSLHNSKIYSICIGNNFIASGSMQGVIIVVNYKNQLIKTIRLSNYIVLKLEIIKKHFENEIKDYKLLGINVGGYYVSHNFLDQSIECINTNATLQDFSVYNELICFATKNEVFLYKIKNFTKIGTVIKNLDLIAAVKMTLNKIYIAYEQDGKSMVVIKDLIL